jgi:hypothetical protein
LQITVLRLVEGNGVVDVVLAAEVRATWADNFIETARPAGSSEGEVIWEPEDRRASDERQVRAVHVQLRGGV